MKKLILLFFSLLAIGSLFQACDNSKTYAEMLEDEKNAVNKFIRDNGITIISKDEFEKDTITDTLKNEYVAFSNGVYMQIVDRGVIAATDTFANNDYICARYVEANILDRDTTSFNVFLSGFKVKGVDVSDISQTYTDPLVFRYVVDKTNIYGIVTGTSYLWSYSTAVPSGWLLALPYLRDKSHVRLIVPSKMGHSTASQNVTPYYYDIWNFQKW